MQRRVVKETVGMTPQQAKDSAEYFYSCAAAENPCESVRCSYLAAVKGAGILIARHPRLARTRPLTRDVWTLLARLLSLIHI